MDEILRTLAPVAGVVVAVIVYVGQTSRVNFELARSLHSDLTSGDVARARDQLGTLMYSSTQSSNLKGDELLVSYFTLLWCFERIYYGRESLVKSSLTRRLGKALSGAVSSPTKPPLFAHLVNHRSRAEIFFDDAIKWHVRE